MTKKFNPKNVIVKKYDNPDTYNEDFESNCNLIHHEEMVEQYRINSKMRKQFVVDYMNMMRDFDNQLDIKDYDWNSQEMKNRLQEIEDCENEIV